MRTGTVYETECFFPTWINKETAAHVQALIDAHHALWGDKRIGHKDADPKLDAMRLRERPLTDKWTFSTNGVSIQGRYGIPCVGFGPGAESQAHAPNEITWKTVPVHAGRSYMYMLTFTSWPYFFTAGRSSISFRQLSQVSPATSSRTSAP